MVSWMAVIGTPRAPAFCQSTSIRYSGQSSSPLGRTRVNLGSLAAIPRSWLRAAISPSWPRPPRSCNWKSNPLALPSSMTAGGVKAYTLALWICENARMALSATAPALSSGRLRSFQSLSLIKAIPIFCPRPAWFWPLIVRMHSTASFSFTRK